jgi:hypothetical protein
MGRELRIQLGENKGDKYTTWREQGRHVRKQMADEKNQGSQQAPRKKKSKRERERERKKERKKERKERKKEGHEMETTRTTSTETDNGQGASDEHPVRRKHPERTTAMKREVSKQVGNKQRDGRGNRWDTRRVLYPKQPNEEH